MFGRMHFKSKWIVCRNGIEMTFFLIFDVLLFAIPTKSIVHFFLLVALLLRVVRNENKIRTKKIYEKQFFA